MKTRRKFLAALLALAMIFSAFAVISLEVYAAEKPVYDIKEPVAGTGELAKNGGFEILTTAQDGPADWTPSGVWKDNPFASISKEIVHSGQQSLKLTANNNQKTCWIRQMVPVTPKTEYQVSVWINAAELSSAMGVGYKYEFYKSSVVSADTSAGIDGVPEKYSYVSKSKEDWVQYAMPVTTPEDCSYLLVYLRMYCPVGTVYFDDFSVYQTSEIKMLTLETDEFFYYTDWDSGTATATLTKAYSQYENGTVSFKLKDGSNIIGESSDNKLANGAAAYNFKVAQLTVKGKEYLVEATLKDENGNHLQTFTTPVYRYDRPTALRKDGVYLKDGQPFVPVIGYHVNKSQYSICKNYGINVVQLVTQTDTAALKALLDKAQAEGLMAMVCLYIKGKPAGDPSLIETTRAMVSAAKDHPATFAYAVLDEPSGYLSDFDVLRISYKEIRDIDPVHPVYMVEPNKPALKIIEKCVDILATDPYPGVKEVSGRTSQTYVSDLAANSIEAAKGRKPVYTILQAFDFKGLQPTAEHIRHYLWQSILSGVKGTGYYALDEMRDGVTILKTELWDGISGFSKQEFDIAAKHFIYHEGVTLKEYKDNGVWYHVWADGSDLYAVIIDRDGIEKDITIPLKSDDGVVSIGGFTATLVSDSAKSPVKGSLELKHHLTVHQAAFYKITLDNPSVLSELGKYTDLQQYPWAKDQINALKEKGIVNDIAPSKYGPEMKITRGDFAMFLVRTLGLTGGSTENFEDVDANAEYAKEIAVGKAAGILKGIGDNKYNPEAEISRQDLMTIIARGMNLTGTADLSAFTDNGDIADYALDSVKAMIQSGLIKGNADGTLNPKGSTTRAEAAVIMYRIINP